jgi:hypothetical protein
MIKETSDTCLFGNTCDENIFKLELKRWALKG